MDESDYTLPPGDPCAPALEAYKQYLRPLVDDYWQVTVYEQQAPTLAGRQHCCPGSAGQAAWLQPDKAILPSLENIPLPSALGVATSCSGAIHAESWFGRQIGKGETWLQAYSKERESVWRSYYYSFSNQLDRCCTDQLSACLARADRPAPGAPAGEASAAAARCVLQYSGSPHDLLKIVR